MKSIDLPEFGPPEDFVDLHDIVKQHQEQDLAWEAEISQDFKHDPESSEEVHGTPD
jgi:hypothetical protein